tara:strand:+ start:7544 stop:7837 length:294 start_codon:yes stop_codon:yes gene_type:complete
MSSDLLRQAGYLPKVASEKTAKLNPLKLVGKAIGGKNYAGLLFLPLMVGSHPGMINPKGVSSAVRAPIKRVRIGGDPMVGRDLLKKHVLRQLERAKK